MALGTTSVLGTYYLSRCLFFKDGVKKTSKFDERDIKAAIMMSTCGVIGVLTDLALNIIAIVGFILITTKVITIPYPLAGLIIAGAIPMGEIWITSIVIAFQVGCHMEHRARINQ